MSRNNRKPYAAMIDSPVGMLGLTIANDYLVGIDIVRSGQQYVPRQELARECASQLRAYFTNPHFSFDLPLLPVGTDYQHRVWKALQKIKPGSTTSYGVLAEKLSTGARAIGNACRANPIPVVIPCHRVVAANGPGGYSGAIQGVNLDRKLWLLQHEARQSGNQ